MNRDCFTRLCDGLSAVLLVLPLVASAARVQIEISDQNGAAVQNAVVSITPTSGKLPPRVAGKAIIDQIHRRFVPLVSVIQTGTLVTFPNKDNIEHDVYSFSPAKVFELNLYSGIAAKPVEFDKPGLVVLGCNIHDEMIGYVMVVDTPYFAKSDANGVASFDDLPQDSYELSTWSYRQSGTAPVSSKLDVHGDTKTRVVLQLKS